MKNRYGAAYHYEKIGENQYKFVMSKMEHCRIGGKEEYGIDYDDLGMFDPMGGPYVGIGSKIYFDEILNGQKDDDPLIVKRIRSTNNEFIVEVE